MKTKMMRKKKKICSFLFFNIASSTICEQTGIWPIAKNNYTARLPCKGSAVGLKTRACIDKEYKPEVSSCVNLDLHDIQKDVQVSLFVIHLPIPYCWPDLLLVLNAFSFFLFFIFIITGIK